MTGRALMIEQNDEWAVSRRYMSMESLKPLTYTDDQTLLQIAA